MHIVLHAKDEKMGTELEFIDISKEEENEIPRASNGSTAGRMPGAVSPRRSRGGTNVMIDMKGQRRPGPEGRRQRIEARTPDRRVKEPELEMPARRRAGPEEQVPERRRSRSVTPMLADEPSPLGRRPRSVTPMLADEPSPPGRRPRSVTPMLADEPSPPRRRPRPVASMPPEEPVRRRRRPGTSAPQRGNVKRRPRPADPEAEREKAARRRRRRRKRVAARMGTTFFMATLIVGSVFLLYKLLTHTTKENEPQPVVNHATSVQREEVIAANEKSKPVITEDFLTVNEYSRPGEPLEQVNNIFVHYTANPGTSAAQNRSYFENLGITGETSASAHFVIGYDGEIIQCIPLNEIGYAVMKRNYDSVSIECCYLTDDGKFTDATYQSLIRLCAWLLNEYGLAPEDMMRHYDEGGKKCPLYYVENEEAWNQFLRDLENYIMNVQA
jgi:N-acetylmuramoyl-L-alanine amidase